VVLVVTDPLGGAGRAHPLRWGAVTRLGSCADIGCRVSVNKSMDSGCQSGFRRNHQKSRSAILQRFCGIPLAEKRDVVVKKDMSHLWFGARGCAALMSLGRVAERCAFHRESAGFGTGASGKVSDCERHVKVGVEQ